MKGAIFTVRCPFCGGEAMANYKSRGLLGKCISVKCHRVFRITEENFASKQEYGSYLESIYRRSDNDSSN